MKPSKMLLLGTLLLTLSVNSSVFALACIDVEVFAPVLGEIGGEALYFIYLSNCGDVLLEDIWVESSLLGGVLPEFPSELPPGAEVWKEYLREFEDGDPNRVFIDVNAGGRGGSVIVRDDDEDFTDLVESPVAFTGGPYSGTPGVPMIFDGSGSDDPDGTIVSYFWDFGDGGTGTGINPTHTYAAAGTYTVTLTVTDNDGLTDTASTTAEIEAASTPVADAGGPYDAVVGVPVEFDGTGSVDPWGGSLTYYWNFGDGSTGTGPEPNHVYTEPGTYEVTLFITNDIGMPDTASTTVTVSDGCMSVDVDIRPGGCPNPFNPKSKGVLPVAILGAADFDVTTIDPTTLTLAGVHIVLRPTLSDDVLLDDVTEPHESDPDAEECEDCFDEEANYNFDSDGDGVDDTYIGDGYLDLVVKFDAQELADAIRSKGGASKYECLELPLVGKLFRHDAPIEGRDIIVVIKPIIVDSPDD